MGGTTGTQDGQGTPRNAPERPRNAPGTPIGRHRRALAVSSNLGCLAPRWPGREPLRKEIGSRAKKKKTRKKKPQNKTRPSFGGELMPGLPGLPPTQFPILFPPCIVGFPFPGGASENPASAATISHRRSSTLKLGPPSERNKMKSLILPAAPTSPPTPRIIITIIIPLVCGKNCKCA